MTTCTAHIDRRGFLDRAAKFAVGGMTAVMLLDLLNPKFAEAQQVPKDDKRLKTEWVEIDSPKGNGKIKAYVCRPANAAGQAARRPRGPREPRPQSAHRRHRAPPGARQLHGGRARRADAARRLPRRRRQGARAEFQKLDQPKTREDFIAATHYLRTRPDCTGKIGAVGLLLRRRRW